MLAHARRAINTRHCAFDADANQRTGLYVLPIQLELTIAHATSVERPHARGLAMPAGSTRSMDVLDTHIRPD